MPDKRIDIILEYLKLDQPFDPDCGGVFSEEGCVGNSKDKDWMGGCGEAEICRHEIDIRRRLLRVTKPEKEGGSGG